MKRSSFLTPHNPTVQVLQYKQVSFIDEKKVVAFMKQSSFNTLQHSCNSLTIVQLSQYKEVSFINEKKVWNFIKRSSLDMSQKTATKVLQFCKCDSINEQVLLMERKCRLL
jgi:hypothetical protein